MVKSVCDGDWEKNNRWRLFTNWTVAAGSLSAAVSVDSSDSPIVSQTLQQESTANRSPLVLTPPSPHSHPCEINISFTQKQEVRQVYVRSTARVYEIYTAHSLGSTNDYLCTVHCGIASRDGEVLHAADVEPVGAHSKESSNVEKEQVNSSSEDDWVEVKVLDMPSQDDRLNLVHKKNGVNPQANLQDLYEATAEFTDSDACTSLTLRLLSLQTKDWIYIDEIYVFADPAESADLEAHAAPVGNSATTSLLSMLVPTLLQLSKPSNAQKQDLPAPNSSGNGDYLDVGSEVNHSTDLENEREQKINKAVTKVPDLHIPEKELDAVQKYNIVAQTDVLSNRFENGFEQLLSRMSRIEDICLRFEENMLHPIKSMEQRLQLVEDQVQVLVKNSQHAKLPLYTRIFAPEFSCGESTSSSFYTEGIENPSCGEVALEKKDTTSDEVSNLSNAKFQPGLVISAPEFSCHHDEENKDNDEARDSATEPVDDCLQEKPKQATSLDDALAAAFSGFMVNTSTQLAHSTQALIVKAPEFTMEENDNDGMPTKQNENTSAPPIFRGELNGMECKDRIISSSSEGHDEQDKLVSDSVHCLRNEAERELVQPHDSQPADSTSFGKPSYEIKDPVSLENDLNLGSESTEVEVGDGILENTIKLVEMGDSQNADSIGVGALRDEATISISGKSELAEECFKNTEVESKASILENGINYPWASRAVDFELPILDVKFTSSEFASTSSLEALFDNMCDFVNEASSMEQKIEDEKLDAVPSSLLTDNQLLFDWEGNDALKGPSSLEDEALDDSLACDKQGNIASLL